MSPRDPADRRASDFLQLLREFLLAHERLTLVVEGVESGTLSFESIRDLVGDDDGSVLYRLKEKSHTLFRSDEYADASVRREALFDLAVGSLFHEAMVLRESLYQREVYGPRVDSLRAVAGDEAATIFAEFDRILARSRERLAPVLEEVRDLLRQTRDQFGELIVERADERGVMRLLLHRRAQIDSVFDDGFEGLLVTMHGSFGQGLFEAALGLVDSAYFVEAGKTLREARGQADAPRAEIDLLLRYAEGMQSFLDGEYIASLASLEAWVDLGAHEAHPELARRAGAALGRLGRLVENDGEGSEMLDAAKQLQQRLESGAGAASG